jgi:hypothetical protein
MSIGSAAGYCQIHKMDKMFVGLEDATEPTCVRCVADSTPKIGRTVVAEDPGEDYFKGKGTNAKITTLTPTHGGIGQAVVKQPAYQIEPVRLEDIVGVAVSQLKRLPMPEDVREFKKVQKIIKTLQSLVENTNG